MKRILVVLLVLFVAGFAMADVKFAESTIIYAYDNLATNVVSYEVCPSVTATIDKLSLNMGGDACFADFTALTSGNLYFKTAYDFGFVSVYAKPILYLSGVFGIDSSATINIPHFPVTVEYTASDLAKFGSITASLGINF